MNNKLGRLGGQLGVLLCLLGFIAIFFGWNGAASHGTSVQQFPFLISGGIAGVSIVVIGAALMIVQNAREDRARLEAMIARLITAVERQSGPVSNGAPAAASAGLVLAGGASYHRMECALPAAREEAHLIRIEDVIARGLTPCRVCNPPALGQPAYH